MGKVIARNKDDLEGDFEILLLAEGREAWEVRIISGQAGEWYMVRNHGPVNTMKEVYQLAARELGGVIAICRIAGVVDEGPYGLVITTSPYRKDPPVRACKEIQRLARERPAGRYGTSGSSPARRASGTPCTRGVGWRA